MLLESVTKYRTESEEEAKNLIERFRAEAAQKHYTIKKIGYEYRVKKASGEIAAEAWIVTVTQIFNDLWEGLI